MLIGGTGNRSGRRHAWVRTDDAKCKTASFRHVGFFSYLGRTSWLFVRYEKRLGAGNSEVNVQMVGHSQHL